MDEWSIVLGLAATVVPTAAVIITALLFNTGYLTEQSVGDWAMRIMGERLSEDVVLGHPSSATWTVP